MAHFQGFLPFDYSYDAMSGYQLCNLDAHIDYQSDHLMTTDFQSAQSTIRSTTSRKRKSDKNNEKERLRNQALNDAFLHLQHRIPYTPSERLPKVKTIRLAVKYIQYLNELLDGQSSMAAQKVIKEEIQEPTCKKSRRKIDFAQIAACEIQSKNSYVHRATDFIQITKPQQTPMTTLYPYPPAEMAYKTREATSSTTTIMK